MSFIGELWHFMKVRKKFWLLPILLVMFLFGGLISFAAKRIKVVATSSAEAEYAAAAYTCKEIVFVRNLCDFFGIKVDGPTLLCVDNQAAIAVAENLGVTGRNKHFTDSIHYCVARNGRLRCVSMGAWKSRGWQHGWRQSHTRPRAHG